MIFPCNPLMGIDVMRSAGCQRSKRFSAALIQQMTRFSGQLAAHLVVVTVDGEPAIGADRASKGLLFHLPEPAIGIDRRGNAQERRERRASHPRRLVATGARLVGPLVIVVRQERLGDFRHL
jgi:hypothetical protein